MSEDKYIVVVEFPDGTRKEYIAFDGDRVRKGYDFKGGKIISYRQLSKKS